MDESLSLELNPTQNNLYTTLAEVYLIIGDNSHAIASAKKALEFSPKDSYNHYFN